MTDPESILQLGIEAARDGNKEEARNLFRLLTREDPRNVQAWIWLAGVAENREERRSSLEQVLQLDPDNQLALKGLQALDEKPDAQSTDQQSTPRHEPAPPVPTSVIEPSSHSPYDRYDDMDDDDPFAELDSLSEVFQEDPGAVRREDPAFAAAQLDDSGNESQRGDTTTATDRGTSSSRSKPSPIGGGRSTSSSASRSSASRRDTSSKKEKESMRGNTNSSQIPRVALIALVALLLIIGLVIVFRDRLPIIGSGSEQPPAAEQPPAEQPPAEQPPAEQPPVEQPPVEQPPVEQPASQPTTTPLPGELAPEVAPPDQPAPDQPPPDQPPPDQPPPDQPPPDQPAPAPADGDLAAANPAIVPPGTPLDANGWAYDFPGWPPGPVLNIGEFNGRFIVVITNIINNTGQEQPVAADFFVLKDGQGRVYTPRPDVSSAYLTSGGVADLSLQDPVPADGITRSVPVIFDIAPDADNLVFFSQYNTSQGWQIR